MYKPRTVEQYKILEFIREEFHVECLIVSPVSRSCLMIEDIVGSRMAFQWKDGLIWEAPIPAPATTEECRAFVQSFCVDSNYPYQTGLDELTDWWLNTPNPLTHQQALNLPDDLYRRYLTCERMLDLEDVLALVMGGRVTPEQLLDLRLWFFDGHSRGNWLGPVGLDGLGKKYELVYNWNTPAEMRYPFYLSESAP